MHAFVPVEYFFTTRTATWLSTWAMRFKKRLLARDAGDRNSVCDNANATSRDPQSHKQGCIILTCLDVKSFICRVNGAQTLRQHLLVRGDFRVSVPQTAEAPKRSRKALHQNFTNSLRSHSGLAKQKGISFPCWEPRWWLPNMWRP